MAGGGDAGDHQQNSDDAQSPTTQCRNPNDEAREADAQLDGPGDRFHVSGP